jgi:hypothetical protein
MSASESPVGVNPLYLSQNPALDGSARVTPEPPADERAVLLAALAETDAEEARDVDPWTAAAWREAVEKEPDSP